MEMDMGKKIHKKIKFLEIILHKGGFSRPVPILYYLFI